MNAASTRGLTLMEVLVTLLIMSVLAAVALPHAETLVRREKELALRRTLRDTRTAIDAFHDDWKAGRIGKTGNAASDDGYPRSLQVLVDGVELADARGARRRYLRTMPIDPWAERGTPPDGQWRLFGLRDAPDSAQWGGRDVYDLRSRSDKEASDGTHYREW